MLGICLTIINQKFNEKPPHTVNGGKKIVPRYNFQRTWQMLLKVLLVPESNAGYFNSLALNSYGAYI